MIFAPETISNYQRLGLIDEDVDRFDEQTNINALMAIGLYKIAFMPYAYILDLWRWDLYQGKVKPEDANCHWHKLRQDYQGKKSKKYTLHCTMEDASKPSSRP